MAGPYFGSFGARGPEPTSFGPRDTVPDVIELAAD